MSTEVLLVAGALGQRARCAHSNYRAPSCAWAHTQCKRQRPTLQHHGPQSVTIMMQKLQHSTVASDANYAQQATHVRVPRIKSKIDIGVQTSASNGAQDISHQHQSCSSRETSVWKGSGKAKGDKWVRSNRGAWQG